MQCPRCQREMSERKIEPYALGRMVTLYECRNVLCEYDEEEMEHRQRWLKRQRSRAL